MSPNPPLRDTSIAEELESLLDHHPSEVQADLENAFGSRLPTWWRPAAQEPRRWIEAFAAASKEAGYVFSTVWNDAQSLLEREIARIGVAVVRNALDVLLNSLHPRIRYHQGAIQVGEPGGTETDLGTRRLVLVPMVSPRSATAISFDMPDVAYIGYPVPALTAKGIMTSAAYPNTDSDPLVVVLGSLRAQLLRSTESPLTMGQLASRLDRTPRTVTYHCDWLEEAGLVTRERRGQAVVLSRTPRGDELVGLLGG